MTLEEMYAEADRRQAITDAQVAYWTQRGAKGLQASVLVCCGILSEEIAREMGAIKLTRLLRGRPVAQKFLFDRLGMTPQKDWQSVMRYVPDDELLKEVKRRGL